MRPRLAFCLSVAALLLVAGCDQGEPLRPDRPSGPASAIAGEVCSFSTATTDPQGDSVSFRFDWDGEMSDWTAHVCSGESASAGHSWSEAGEYEVRVQARDVAGHTSDWSDPHGITISPDIGHPDTLVNIITGIGEPVGIASSPDGQFVYVAARGSGELVVVRVADDSVLARVTVGSRPHAVCVLPDGRYAYVCNSGGDNVSAVRLSDNTVVATVPVGDFPVFSTALPNSEYVYVSNQNSGTVSVIRTSDNTVVNTVGLGSSVWGSAAAPDGQHVYVGLLNEGQLKVIRTSDNSVVGTISVHPGPEGMSVLPGGEFLYVACRTGSSGYVDVVRLSDNTVVAAPAVDGYPVDVVPLPNGRYVYAASFVGDAVHAIATESNEVVWTLNDAEGACYIAAPSNRRVYVCCSGGNQVQVIGRSPGR